MITLHRPVATPKVSGTWWHIWLKIHSQAVGNPVDVVEVADDLCGITDGLWRKASSLQFCDIGLGGVMRVARQFLRPRA